MICSPWRVGIQALGSLGVLVYVNWQLAVGAGLLVPWLYISISTWMSRLRPRMRDIHNRRQQIDALAAETFGGIRVVRSFSREQRELNRFVQSSHLMCRQELKAWWWRTRFALMWEAMMPFGLVGLLSIGGWQVLTGNLTVGDLTMLLVYALVIMGPITVLLQASIQMQDGMSALDRILDILGEPTEHRDEVTKRRDKTQFRGSLSIQNVRFRYPGTETPALENVSFDVQSGETIALVGPSGAGKTTLCSLIARFYEVTEGRILLDDEHVEQIDLDSYRRILGLVEQDIFLFDGTIAENIEYGARGVTQEEIERAARLAGADGFIQGLADGYRTRMGERGVKLSEGQRQRIAIARAIVGDPKILILDEATSNLDLESERAIQDALQSVVKDRTCFIIAHRSSTIQLADRILAVEHGSVREIYDRERVIQTSVSPSSIVDSIS